jgi:signal transduction histidine kinase
VSESAIVGVPKVPVDDEPFRVLARTFESDGGAYTVYVGGSLEQVEESTASLLVLLRFGIPLVLLGVAAGTWMLVGRALAPVESIRAEVAEISGHETGRRVPEPSTLDEIGRLARTMNEMLARIDEAQDRQRRFVADASHELRSPLATMRTQLEVDETHPETAAWETTSKDLHAEIVRMQRLVDELLFLARSDASRLAQRRPVDLDDIVLDEVRRARASSPVTIDSSAVSAGQVSGDHDQLRRVVRNLLDNALEHARCAVAIRLGEDGERVTLVVDDDGEGIPVESREQVFERFVRLDGARTPGRGGIGLGLAITRAIVEAHGGAIAAEDGSALGGARFIVTFPAAWAAPRARAGGERTGQASSAGFQPE